LSWERLRSIFAALSLRDISTVSFTSYPYRFGEESPYEKELLIVEQRRVGLESQRGVNWVKSFPATLPIERIIGYEQRWLDTLEQILQFYYKEGRLPKHDKVRKEGSLATTGKTTITEEGRLANWICMQRQAKRCLDEGKRSRNKMTPERIATLQSMSWWIWDAWEAAWQSSFDEIVDYVKSKVGEIPSQSHPNLGKWVDTQRTAYKAWQARLHGETEKYKDVTHYMDEERARKLESIPGWSWDPIEDNWEGNYQELVKYVATHNKLPPQSHSTLGYWINRQRTAYKAWQARLHGETEKYKNVSSYMDEERARKLESIPGWSWVMRG
jgi:hypothetical protein